MLKRQPMSIEPGGFMSGRRAAAPASAARLRLPSGPVHRSIFVVDLEGSTTRTNPVKGDLRRTMYDLLEQALKAAGIRSRHVDQWADRGDGVLILIRPDDDVPKTVLFDRLIPALTTLLAEHNATVTRPELGIRLRAVIHAGEVHEDRRGYFGDDLDVAFRLLNAHAVKRALKAAAPAPLALVVSEEIFHGVLRHGYIEGGLYQQRVHVQVGQTRRRGRVHIPVVARPDLVVPMPRAPMTSPAPAPAR
jgi:class 3 adenylate cyclase